MTGRASRRALVAVVATLGLALVTVVAAAVLDTLTGAGTTASTRSIPAFPPAPSDALRAPGDASDTGASATPKSEPQDAAPITEQQGSEASPATGETSPIGLPPSPPLPDLVTLPLPPSASETGALAPGYPAGLVPPVPGATVTSSSVASAERHLQVTLAADTSMEATAVLDFYRAAFAANSLVDSVAPAAGGSSALLFSRGSDTVVLTVTPTAGGSTYGVFGAFSAKH
ncbi:hypothetical protein [Mycetocola sp. 2940]|uniref:hypothetical protein n=1 Tax=Mycetocola sp. 2940 TaxID=3156452 RepID=UPI003394CA0F